MAPIEKQAEQIKLFNDQLVYLHRIYLGHLAKNTR